MVLCIIWNNFTQSIFIYNYSQTFLEEWETIRQSFKSLVVLYAVKHHGYWMIGKLRPQVKTDNL